MFWLATQNRNFKIFQHQTVPQIVEQILLNYDLTFQFDLYHTERYEAREYCVQYNESDFGFISRLLALEGIHYEFKHFEDGHELHFYDANEAHKEIVGYEVIDYLPDGTLGLHSQSHCISQWQSSRRLHPSHFETSDYDFRKPNVDVRNNHRHVLKHSKAML